MSYAVKELFFTLQGEGAHTGRAAVFLRFAGCNLWSGREEDRATAVCQFCDTEFIGTDGPGGGRFADAEELARAVNACWQANTTGGGGRCYVVCTGGEPLLQLDEALVAALHQHDFEIAIETNGTLIPPPGVDWVCMSPKAHAKLALLQGNELKLVFPQKNAEPERYSHLQFQHFFLQPMDGPERLRHTALAAEYCQKNPQWRLSLQTHKLIGLP
jgi:7-carboxy-7-deazaguanine synthase (Cx14CxxC type)